MERKGKKKRPCKMESNLFLETKINNKSLRLDGSFDPKLYFSTAFFVSD